MLENDTYNNVLHITLENKFSVFKTLSREVKRHGQNICIIIDIKNYICVISAGLSIPGQYTWVGGDDQADEGKFKWLNGSPVQGIPWHSSEPNNGSGNSDCMVMYNSNEKFYDKPCTNAYSFLCELN